MCTLILGQDVLAPGTVLLAANRDEDPARPSGEPQVLHQEPRVIGGRDLRAGGTWLAVREGRAAAALLNRRGEAGAPVPKLRSRGLLTLETAAATGAPDDPGPRMIAAVLAASPALNGSGPALAAATAAITSLRTHAYAPLTLLWAAPEGSWAIAHGARSGELQGIEPGWHVIAHDDLDDRREPRVGWLLDRLERWQPASFDEARDRLAALLATHGDRRSVPPVCLHGGRAETVSSSLLLLGTGGPRYFHGQGPPCKNELKDHSSLLL